MGKLGFKISKAFVKLGDKSTQAFNKLGDKSSSLLDKTKHVAGRLDNVANNAINKGTNIVNNIPNINEKAINLSQNIIKKSGGITDVLRKGSAIGDKIIQGVNDLGGADIPVIGKAITLASKGTHQLAVGAKKLDSTRDTANNKLNKYAEVSRNTIGDIEKVNARKKAEIADALSQDNTDAFV